MSLLVIDEAAHVEALDELWTALYPTLSTGGRCIALSTPNGVGNWFHKTCADSESGANNFNLTSLMWDVHPERDEEWYKKETRNMSKRQIAQELSCAVPADLMRNKGWVGQLLEACLGADAGNQAEPVLGPGDAGIDQFLGEYRAESIG